MNALQDIHDGFFDGLLLSEEKTAHLFLRTCAGQRSTVVLKDVERMSVQNFMQGNIIFDVVLIEPSNLTIAHIEQAYQLQPSQTELAQKLLEEAQQRKLLVLEINPSYGAEFTALFGAVEILPTLHSAGCHISSLDVVVEIRRDYAHDSGLARSGFWRNQGQPDVEKRQVVVELQ